MKLKYYLLRNAMGFGNFTANLVGWAAVEILSRSWLPEAFFHAGETRRMLAILFPPAAFFFASLANVAYELPFRSCFRAITEGKAVSPQLLQRARRRTLNQPYFAAGLDFAIWLVAGISFGLVVHRSSEIGYLALASFLQPVVTGLLTAILAFFFIEHVIQHRLAPILFPNGALHAVRGTLRIRIGTRTAALVFATSLVPLCAILLTIYGFSRITAKGVWPPAVVFQKLQVAIVVETIGFILFAVCSAFFVAVNQVRALGEMTRVLKRVSRGDFGQRVQVVSNDEIGYVGDVINEMAEGLEEREFIKDTFGKYVTREVRDEILEGRIPLDGETKEVTLLFADLREFTRMVETTIPKAVVKVINRYFAEMSSAIRDHGGLVLQFIGDEIEAVFGAPLALVDHPQAAVRAALEMRERLVKLNEELEAWGGPVLRHGIGVHTGSVLAANIGSPDRLSYAMVGDTVNLASRIQELNKNFGTDILISVATFERLDGSVHAGKLPEAKVKGKTAPVEVFQVF